MQEGEERDLGTQHSNIYQTTQLEKSVQVIVIAISNHVASKISKQRRDPPKLIKPFQS